MKPYGNQINLKEKFHTKEKKVLKKISLIEIKLIHQIFDSFLDLSVEEMMSFLDKYQE